MNHRSALKGIPTIQVSSRALYVTVMGEAIEQRGRHLWVAEHGWPFAKGEVGGDDDGGLLVKLADQMEQELSAGLSEGQIPQFIQDDEVEAHQMFGQPSSAAGAGLRFQLVDQVHDVEEAATSSIADDRTRDGNGDVGLARACPANQHHVALLVQELSACQIAHQRLVDWRSIEGELFDLAGEGQFGDCGLVFD